MSRRFKTLLIIIVGLSFGDQAQSADTQQRRVDPTTKRILTLLRASKPVAEEGKGAKKWSWGNVLSNPWIIQPGENPWKSPERWIHARYMDDSIFAKFSVTYLKGLKNSARAPEAFLELASFDSLKEDAVVIESTISAIREGVSVEKWNREEEESCSLLRIRHLYEDPNSKRDFGGEYIVYHAERQTVVDPESFSDYMG